MKKVLKWIGIVFLGLLILGWIIDATKSPEKKAAQAAERAEKTEQEIAALPTLTANNLAAAYDENTVAADQKFKGKKYKVSGTVVSINTDIMGDPYITLRGGVNQFMEPQFSFSKSEAPQLARLKPGSKVTLVCVGKGDVAKIPMSGSCSVL